jgi:hypothetical protein
MKELYLDTNFGEIYFHVNLRQLIDFLGMMNFYLKIKDYV